MRHRTYRVLMPLGLVIAVALAAGVLVLPSLAASASGKDKPKADEAKDTEASEAEQEEPGDFRIDLSDKEGKELEQAIDEAIANLEEQVEALNKQIDELRRRSPRGRDFDRDRPHVLWWQHRPQRQRNRQPRPEVEELLRELERELPRDWPLHMQERLREIESDWPRDGEPFQFKFKLGPDSDRSAFSLRMDMKDTDEGYVLRLDLPGMDKEEIVVEVDDGILSVSGERKEHVEEEKDGQHVRREIMYGRFKRAVTLPRDAELGKITSEYKDGVLTVTVPKKEQKEEENKRIIVHHP